MFSHDAINRELRALARAEARERYSVETRLLSVGFLDREVGEAPRPLLTPGWGPVRIRGPLAALGHARRRVLGESR